MRKEIMKQIKLLVERKMSLHKSVIIPYNHWVSKVLEFVYQLECVTILFWDNSVN